MKKKVSGQPSAALEKLNAITAQATALPPRQASPADDEIIRKTITLRGTDTAKLDEIAAWLRSQGFRISDDSKLLQLAVRCFEPRAGALPVLEALLAQDGRRRAKKVSSP